MTGAAALRSAAALFWFVRKPLGGVECRPLKQGDTGGITVNAPTRSKSEIARLGDEIYQRDIQSKVETDHHGEYVAIDVETGHWAISGDLREAAKGLRAQFPEAGDVWLLRVGYRALHHFGGRPSLRSTR